MSEQSFGLEDLEQLLRDSEEQELWAEKRGYAITGDSAPPPIPLGLEEGDPAGMRKALKQARKLQKGDPPPPGRTWHMSRSSEAELARRLGSDTVARLLRNDEDGEAEPIV